jgi:hypothetical protein
MYTNSENYVEIDGIKYDLADDNNDTLILPYEVAFKIAAAILRSRVRAGHPVDCGGNNEWSSRCWVCDSGLSHETVIKLLDGLLSNELDDTEGEQT